MPDVVCLGILVADVLGRPIDSMPPRGKLSLVDQIELHIGGCAANVSIDLARLGFNTATLGMVGNDGFGDFVVQTLEKSGVDAGGVVRTEEAHTSATMIMVHADGERSFLHYIGANAAYREEHVDFDRVRAARVLHVAGALVMPGLDGEPMARVLKRAREAGVMTALDTVYDATGRWMSVLAPCLEHADLFLPSLEEAKCLTGQDEPPAIAQALMDRGVGTVVIKLGERGSYIRSREGELRLPAYKITPVDGTGSGDAFVAGFLAGHLSGWDLEKTGRFANAVGAMCVTALGTTAGVRSMQETLEFMQTAEVLRV
ncbi:MAG: carbohydrate kinase family protein [Armatimonadota bacterium]